MATTSPAPLMRHLHEFLSQPVSSSVGDVELLERFVGSHDVTAFELLVWRHQRMVLGVCRRVLRDRHDAEDAFQATFLALVSRAHSINRGEALAAWLHRVAYHVALRVRKGRAKRAAVTSIPERLAQMGQDAVVTVHDFCAEKFKLPVVIRTCQ
jgi:DNA-directed RNA polymerase specialized sigma24 family protein